MKKLIILSLVLFASSQLMQLKSQSIGVKGGLNYANMLEQSDIGTFSENYKYLPGFNLGAFIEVPMSGEIIMESGLFLNTKGFRIDAGDDVTGVKGTFKTLWVDIPFKAKATKSFGPLTVFAAGGVSGGFGISGNEDMDITVFGNTTNYNNDILWGTDPDEDDMVRIDYGFIGSVGAEFKSVILELSYYHGIANLSSYTDDEYILSSRYLGISLGYKFGFSMMSLAGQTED